MYNVKPKPASWKRVLTPRYKSLAIGLSDSYSGRIIGT